MLYDNREDVRRLCRLLIMQSGLTQREVARKLGVHETLVSRAIRQTYPGDDTARSRILEFFGFTVHDPKPFALQVEPTASIRYAEAKAKGKQITINGGA